MIWQEIRLAHFLPALIVLINHLDPIEQEIPDLYPSCAVTRAMAQKAKQNDGMQDIALTDTLIGQSFNDEILNSLSPS